MAGLWIEWEKGLARKPEVLQLARILGSTPQHAAGCCMLFWEWTEDVTENGIIPGVTPADASFATGVEGIGEALLEVGWLIETDDGIVLPNWERHNGDPAKKRARNAQRMRVARAKKRAQREHERAGNVHE